MNKEDAKKHFRIICRAFENLCGNDIRRILADTPRKELPDSKTGMHHWKVCDPPTGICFDLSFSDDEWNSAVGDVCEYTTAHRIARTVTLTNKERWKGTCPPSKEFRTGKYRYSISDLCSMFPNEPFYLNHLSADDMKSYAEIVREEMREWDRWLTDKTVSQDKRDSQLALIEERVLKTFAPYIDEIDSLPDLLRLFEDKESEKSEISWMRDTVSDIAKEHGIIVLRTRKHADGVTFYVPQRKGRGLFLSKWGFDRWLNQGTNVLEEQVRLFLSQN